MPKKPKKLTKKQLEELASKKHYNLCNKIQEKKKKKKNEKDQKKFD